MDFILASTSPYRRKQLKDFGVKFRVQAPLFDEEMFKSKRMAPAKLCALLAYNKALSVAEKHPHSVIIGGDQLVSFEGKILGKPYTTRRAEEMLKSMSGKKHELITCICVIYKKKVIQKTIRARIKMKRLTTSQIKAYVKRDKPLKCAGSYMFEKSGLSLVDHLHVSDPSSLTGLPLIELGKILDSLDK